MDPQETIDKIWPAVRRRHLYPALPMPRAAQDVDQVAIEMRDKQIVLNPAFHEQVAAGMATEHVVEALLDHGVSHYTYCPWDLRTHLALYAETKKVIDDQDMAKTATSYFMDVIANTHCVREKETHLPELYRHLSKEGLTGVMSALYQRIWGVDLDAPDCEEVSRLSRIPYLDKDLWQESARRFAGCIKHLLEAEQQIEENPMGGHSLASYSEEEVDQGLRDLAGTVDLHEFEEMIADFAEELEEIGYGDEMGVGEEGGMGRGKGSPIDASLLYYMKLAEQYSLPVRQLPMEKSVAMHPHSHSPWEIGMPVQDIDVWTSFGKIMPGITQTWRKREGDVFSLREGTPDCIVVIDSSGSMRNPKRKLSYAVLGAGCACDAYLRSGSKVAVYNFSDAMGGNRLVLDYTDERAKVYRSLCRYFGGGTALDLQYVELLRQQSMSSKGPDVFIITDMQITNLEKVIGYLSTIDNRVTAVHIGQNRYAAQFKQAVDERQNISVYHVERKEDIPGIVLGKVSEYLQEV